MVDALELSRAPSGSTQAETVRQLIGDLRQNPSDEEAASVLADWCEEKGFEDAARRLRSDSRGLGYLQALSSLLNLFGFTSNGIGPDGRYTVVLGMERTIIDPGDTVTFRALTIVPIRVRKLVIPSSVSRLILVHDVRFGMIVGFHSSDPIDGEMFELMAPDLFDHPVGGRQEIIAMLENISNAPIPVSACWLGLRQEDEGRPDWLSR